MNNFFTQFKDRARVTRLSHDEKQAMRVQLYNYVEQNPAGAFGIPADKAYTPVPSTFYFFSPRYLVPIALLLVVGLGSGTAFAAQSALPGNPLYAVKIHVNEAVQTALATTPEAKAEVNAQLATTRLEEAESLASTGELNAAATAQLAGNFAAHAEAAQANTSDVESNDPGTAAQLGAQFNGALAAHSAILAQIGNDSKSDETMQNSNSLALQVTQEAEHGKRNDDGSAIAIAIDTSALVPPVATTSTTTTAPSNGARIRTFAAATTTATTSTGKAKGKNANNNANPSDAKIAASLGAQASTTLAAVAADFAALKPSLNANTSAQVATQIAGMQTTFAVATAELAAGNTSGAVQDFAAVVRMSVKLDAYLKAGKKFNWVLLTGLLTNLNLNTSGGSNANSNHGFNERGGNDNGKTPGTTTTSIEVQASGGSSNTGSSSEGGGSSDSTTHNSGHDGSSGDNASGTVNVDLHL
jgi:hypothetical protein